MISRDEVNFILEVGGVETFAVMVAEVGLRTTNVEVYLFRRGQVDLIEMMLVLEIRRR